MNNSTSRYSRQIRFAPIGEAGQHALQQSRVSLVGLGALGSVIAQHLARSGVGYIRLIDRDFVEWSNLQRQMLYTEEDASLLLPKAEAAAAHLRQMNSEIHIDAHIADLSAQNAPELLEGVDLVLDGTDNFSVRYLINDYCVKHRMPWIYGGAVSASGMTMTIIPEETPCYSCLFPQPPDPGSADTCETAGVISPIIDIIGSVQATEAIKLLSGNHSSLHRTLFQVDLWNHSWMPLSISHARRSDCPTCSERSFVYLNSDHQGTLSSALCGRNSIQVTPHRSVHLDLKGMAAALSGAGRIESNPYLMKIHMSNGMTFVLFQDGRAIVQGTDDSMKARSIYAELLGI